MPLSILKLPSVSYVQVEPIVVQIDRLDLVLEENDDIGASSNPSRYADRIKKLCFSYHLLRMCWFSKLESSFILSVLLQCFDLNKYCKG